MKSLLLLSCFFLFGDFNDNTPPSKQTDLQLSNLNGQVKTVIHRRGNSATLIKNKWVIKDSNTIINICHYDKAGYDESGMDMIKALVMRKYFHWADDSMSYELMIETGKEEETMLTTFIYTSDTNLLSRSYYVNQDTSIKEQTDETITTYSNHAVKNDYYSVEGTRKKRYLYTLRTYPHKDTTIVTYFADQIEKLTIVALERDSHDNPTKELSYTQGDTSIALYQYTYY